MPEGPEILITKQYLSSKIKNGELISLKVKSGRYTHEKIQGLKLIKNTSLIIKSINSKGKFLWFKLKNDKTVYMMVTFGLSGYWTFDDNSKSIRIEIKIQKNDKIIKLYFVDQRNFGTISFTDDEQILDDKLNKLAPDILQSKLNDKNLIELINNFINSKSTRDKNIVKTLMNQELIVSGIGNYLIAEILYDAKINPHRSFNDLSKSEIKKLAHSMRKISKFAYYDNTIGYMNNLSTFAKNHFQKIKDGKLPDYHDDILITKKFTFNVYGQTHDHKNNPITRDQIIKGRTIYWCPVIQH